MIDFEGHIDTLRAIAAHLKREGYRNDGVTPKRSDRAATARAELEAVDWARGLVGDRMWELHGGDRSDYG